MSEIEDTETMDIPNRVAVSILMEWFDLTDRRIHQLADNGVVVRLGRGEYEFETSVKNYIAYLQDNLTNKPVSESEKEERLKLSAAKRKLAELDLLEREGKLVDAELERKAAYSLAASMRVQFQNLPDRLAAILAGETEELVVYRQLRQEIDNVLINLSKIESSAEGTECH